MGVHSANCPHGHDGTATVQVNAKREMSWLQADQNVLVADELLDASPDFLLAKYAIGNWCDETHAWHATLRGDV